MSSDKQEVAVKKTGGEQKSDMQRYTAPFGQMERMFEDFFQHRFFTPSWMPRLKFTEFADVSASIDMFEEGDTLVIKAEIPGMKKDEISIDFADDVVTISGEKKSEEKTERKDYYCIERSFGSFSRKLRLPVEIQIDKTHASFKDGVLEIRMPKSEAAKQKTRKITVE
ncbi:MAG: Hsp20/alpha crystallin family protein [Desulfuromonadaceae bacterium]|nr:Hsp20/alpha crystallin family protein [Desulfuromonadaceae bacterium]